MSNQKEAIQWIKENNIPIVNINPDRNYWLIRTNSGEYFQDFLLGHYVGINWNEFNDPKDFIERNRDSTTEMIGSTYTNNKQPGHTFTHIKRFFHDIKIGDIVMIPGVNSKYIAFGEVKSNVYFSEKSQTEIDEGECPYTKRRHVEWIITAERNKLDPYLYRMMNSHLTISNAEDYADAIDRTMYSYYYKGDKAHLVLNVNQPNNIPLIDLLEALQAPLDLVDYLQNPINQNVAFDKKDLDAKLRVQSRGIIELVSSGDAFTLVVGLGIVIVGLVGGTFKFNANREKVEGEISTDGLLEKLLKFKNQNKKQEDSDEDYTEEIKELKDKIENSNEKLNIETPEELNTLITKQLSMNLENRNDENKE